MSAWGSPPEPDWVGPMNRACERDTTAKVVTPVMERLLKVLRDGPTIPDPWRDTRSPEAVAELTKRAKDRAVIDLLQEWRTNEEIDFICTFDGEVDVTVEGGRMFWTCPGCGHDHEQEFVPDYEPDPDEMYDRMREEGL